MKRANYPRWCITQNIPCGIEVDDMRLLLSANCRPHSHMLSKFLGWGMTESGLGWPWSSPALCSISLRRVGKTTVRRCCLSADRGYPCVEVTGESWRQASPSTLVSRRGNQLVEANLARLHEPASRHFVLQGSVVIHLLFVQLQGAICLAFLAPKLVVSMTAKRERRRTL